MLLRLQRTTAEPTCFSGMGHVINHVTLQGGIGGNDPINAIFYQGCGHLINFIQSQIRRNFNGQWHVLLILRSQLLLTDLEGSQQFIQRIAILQRTQPRRIGRRDIDGNITGVVIHLVHADQVIILALLDGGVLVLADIDANHP